MSDEADTKTICVLYDGHDNDGFGSAWATWKRFGAAAVYVPVRHGDPNPPAEAHAATMVYVLDFSYGIDRIADLAQSGVCVTLIDHHKTSRQVCDRIDAMVAADPAKRAFLRYVHDTDKSAAVLTWEYMHETPPPMLLQYVQDRDLWKWELPHSRKYSAAISLVPKTFAAWDTLATSLDERRGSEVLAYNGGIVLDYERKQIDTLVAKADLTRIGGHEVYCVNTPFHQSEVGEALCFKDTSRPFAATWFERGDGARVYSLRSRGEFDVSVLAGAFGGGGHPRAAGFVWPRESPCPGS